MKYLLLIIIILAQFDSIAQNILRLSSFSKKDNIETRNYSNERLINSQRISRMKTVEININNSDSLVIEKEGTVPLALINLDKTSIKEFNLELPILPEYKAIDTVITYTTKSTFLSKKVKTVKSEYSPANSQYFDSFPNEILVTINGNQYKGILFKKPLIGVSNLDGKKFSMLVYSVRIEAIYVVQRIE